MIKFFRKIRQKLLNENRFSKYLLYAVGEIILVVIGILIALQINNWNQNRIDRNTELKILNSLENEFKTNLEKLNSTKISNIEVQDNIREFIKHSGPNPTPIDKKEFSQINRVVSAQSVFFEPSIGVFEEILNSGRLNYLQNQLLRNLLSGWDAELSKVRYQENVVEEHRERLKNIIIDHGNLSELLTYSGYVEWNNLVFGESKFLEDPRTLLARKDFTNVALYRLTSSQAAYGHYEHLEMLIDSTLILIEKSKMQ